MAAGLDKVVIEQVKKAFYANCIELLRQACEHLFQEKTITIDSQEGTISAYILIDIKESETAKAHNISLNSESQLYDRKFLQIHTVQQSPRIDLKFSTWGKNDEFSFYVEAKILVEHNAKKTKGSLNAKRLQRRYIKTGIDNYVNGKYPQKGCMLGYVLEGCPRNIIDGINGMLTLDDRKGENIVLKSGEEKIWLEAQSTHKNGELLLAHYFAKFCD